MGAIVLILQLGLVISSGFSESTEDHTRAELDLECLNDFLTEMMCRLTSDQLDNCSEYSLNASRINDPYRSCDFTQVDSSECECSFQVKSGFVLGEPFEINVLRRKNVLFTKNVNTTESIKPKKPFIVSVNQTQNGDYHIVLDTVYTKEDHMFSTDLILELTYYIEGREGSRNTLTLPKGMKEYNLVGRNLESNSNYIVKTRVRSNLNSRFSDYSDPYRFTTSSSPKDILQIIIPIICIILIICMLTMYNIYSKILTVWWVPAPKIATSFVKQVPNSLSFQNEFSPVHLDSSKLVNPGEKIWPASLVVDTRGENSFSSLGRDGNSSEVIYGQTGNESVEENSAGNNTHWDHLKESPSTNLPQMEMSNKYYKNLDSSSGNCNVEREYGNSSGISNKFYMFSGLDKFQNPEIRRLTGESVFPARAANPDPVIPTDFEYGPCTGCSGSPENPSPIQSFTPSSSEIVVVPGYQSVSEVTDCPSTHQAFISSRNDFNLIVEKLMCSKNPQNISCQNGVIPLEDGYKDFQSLLRSSGEQQSLITDPEIKHLCGPALHTSPGIEVDCSYHRV